MTHNLLKILALTLFVLWNIDSTSHAMECRKTGTRCVETGGEKNIEGYNVYRDCWRYEDQFECHYPSKNNCQELIDKDCIQINSECLREVRGKCVNYSQKYYCTKSTEVEEEGIKQNTSSNITNSGSKVSCSGIPCIDGNCADKTYASNDEFLEAVSQLSVLSELKDNIKHEIDPNSLTVFKGSLQSCKVTRFSVKDCCGSSPKGWGVNLKLTKCAAEEKVLMQRREGGYCHYLGKYCAEKLVKPIGCIAVKHVYCCFNSKLARIIHEQARPALGIGWGTPGRPNCQGLTIEQLQRVDFPKLDLGEYYKDVEQKYKAKLAKENPIEKRVVESMKRDFAKMQQENEKGKQKK